MLTLNDANIEQELNQIAQQSGKPINELLKDVLLEYLEDLQDASLGNAVMDDILSGKESVYSSEQAKAMLYDLDG